MRDLPESNQPPDDHLGQVLLSRLSLLGALLMSLALLTDLFH